MTKKLYFWECTILCATIEPVTDTADSIPMFSSYAFCSPETRKLIVLLSYNCSGKTGRWKKQCGARSLDSWRQTRYTPKLSEGFTWISVYSCETHRLPTQSRHSSWQTRYLSSSQRGGGVTEYISESEPSKCHFYFWFRPLFIFCFGVTVRDQLFAEYFLKNDVKLQGSTSLDVADGLCPPPPRPRTFLVRPCGASLPNAACVELRHCLALKKKKNSLLCSSAFS